MFVRISKVGILEGVNKPNNLLTNFSKRSFFTTPSHSSFPSLISSNRSTSLSFISNVKNSRFSSTRFTKINFSQSKLLIIKNQRKNYSTVQLNKQEENSPANITQIVKKEDERNNNNEEKIDFIIILWLAGCTLLVFGIILIGGITRLTESGLSMTDWEFHGGLPPITQEEWIAEFEKYKQFPEFERLNSKMTVDEFKSIYFWEYLHRMWGRAIGLSFGLPYAYFALKKKLPSSLNLKCGAILLGIGFQGLLGWWMVKSGLQEAPHDQWIPRVSQYRLAAHLSAALALYTGMFWTTLDLYSKNATVLLPSTESKTQIVKSLKRAKIFTTMTSGLVLLTAISGAFVAGLDAGWMYNTFPYMGDTIVPEESWKPSQIPLIPISPLDSSNFTPDEIYKEQRKVWLKDNLFENSASVQFNHRVLGCTTAAVVTSLYLSTKQLSSVFPRSTAVARHCVMGAVAMQVTLGITTLLYLVPIPLAAAHQSGSVILLSSHLWFLNQLKKIKIPV